MPILISPPSPRLVSWLRCPERGEAFALRFLKQLTPHSRFGDLKVQPDTLAVDQNGSCFN